MPTIEINGKSLEVERGRMIIEAADDAGIYIPRFCYHKKLSVAANCRMCLVEVEKAPKPLPACATPVADGMKIFTHSEYAREAQKATMEFLLINHPLDCPVCDQGGECPLQDQAMAFGRDVSRFTERKRVVENKDIGPLISTEMTRCIHCTRCIRFGEELGGIMELGATGRGEHMEIGTFIGMTVDSELSGNVIDLCPVGALTSKPYRFSARSWELTSHDSVAVHDCIGSNLNVQTQRDRIKRVLPRTNEAVNECWLSDRDRFSYEACNAPDRIETPLVKVNGEWRETDWEDALHFAATGLKRVLMHHGGEALGGLAAPSSTLEEFYLFQQLMRGLGSENVDHRLRQRDFRNDQNLPPYPSLGGSIEALERAGSILLVGSNIRKQQPLLGLRVLKASKQGAEVMVINPLDYDFRFNVSEKKVADPHEIIGSLARIARGLAPERCPQEVDRLAGRDADETERNITAILADEERDTRILAGEWALCNADASLVLSLLQLIAEYSNARLGVLPHANSTGGWIAGCVPSLQEGGLNVNDMLESDVKGYVFLGCEPELDCANAAAAKSAIERAEFVVAINAYDIRNTTDADVLLPATPWSETDGTFINIEGVAQTFQPAAAPLSESRPAWKVLRVLGNFLELDGFDYVSAAEVRSGIEMEHNGASWKMAELSLTESEDDRADSRIDLHRVSDVPPLRIDGVVRRASSLQQTKDRVEPVARISHSRLEQLGFAAGEVVQMYTGNEMVTLPVEGDARIPDNCIYVPESFPETTMLGMASTIRLVKDS